MRLKSFLLKIYFVSICSSKIFTSTIGIYPNGSIKAPGVETDCMKTGGLIDGLGLWVFTACQSSGVDAITIRILWTERWKFICRNLETMASISWSSMNSRNFDASPRVSSSHSLGLDTYVRILITLENFIWECFSARFTLPCPNLYTMLSTGRKIV